MPSCCLLTQTVYFMKLKQKMFIMIFMEIKVEIQNFLIFLIKLKKEFKRKIIIELVELKSKMYSLVDVDSEENKKAKAVDKNVIKCTRHKKLCFLIKNW